MVAARLSHVRTNEGILCVLQDDASDDAFVLSAGVDFGLFVVGDSAAVVVGGKSRSVRNTVQYNQQHVTLDTLLYTVLKCACHFFTYHRSKRTEPDGHTKATNKYVSSL